jgi:hypothetical protein
MKDRTIEPRKPVKAEGNAEPLTTQPNPPTVRGTRKVLLTIGRERYEFTFHSEVRAITRGPAKLIQMPSRTTIE